VGEAMTTHFDTVDADLPLIDLEQAFLASHHHGFAVLDSESNLFGVVTLQDLELASERGSIEGLLVRDIATTKMLIAYPDEPMWAALKRMSTRDLGRLPVVSRKDERQLVGMIRRGDIVRAYNLAIARRIEVQERQERLKLGRLINTEFVDFELAPESPVVGHKVGELPLPHDCLLVSIRRGRGVIIPRGDSTLQAGDRVTLLVSGDKRAKATRCFGSLAQ
jgi:CIC family chloride channel protein